MLAPWVMDEVKTAKLNDKRLNARLADVLSLLARIRMRAFPPRVVVGLRWSLPIVFARMRRQALRTFCRLTVMRHDNG